MSCTLERLRNILIADYKLAPERLGLDATLADLGIDSLGTVELLWSIEDEFKIKLPTTACGTGHLGRRGSLH